MAADILLDARMMNHSGIGTYIQGLLGVYRRHPFFQTHSLELTLSPSLIAGKDGLYPSVSFHSPIYSLAEQLEYPSLLRRCRLWHAPHYNVPLLKKRGTRLVVTIHDLIHWIFRKEFFSPVQALYARLLLERAVRSADRIIAVSQKTRDDLLQHFHADPEKVQVIYEGVGPEFFQTQTEGERKRVLEKYKLTEPFFLYVGLIKPHKNVKRLVEIFKGLWAEKKIASALVLVGKKDRRYPSGFESLQDLKTEGGIHYLPKVESREELISLYSSARALVLPSLYEGFGLTCLEAMASGTAVIVSQTASLPEVVGDAGHYVDPYSNDSIRQALLEMERDESRRKSLAEKGRARAREFNWSKAGDETIRVYEEVLGRPLK